MTYQNYFNTILLLSKFFLLLFRCFTLKNHIFAITTKK